MFVVHLPALRAGTLTSLLLHHHTWDNAQHTVDVRLHDCSVSLGMVGTIECYSGPKEGMISVVGVVKESFTIGWL